MPQGDVVENYTPFGYFSSGGGEGGYTPVIKRAILQYFYRAYGPESPEYQAAAKRWPKQAHKVEKNPPPRGGVDQAPGRPGDQPLGYDPFALERARGYPRGGPPSGEQVLNAAELLAAIYSGPLIGAKLVGTAAKKLIAKLLARRAALGKAAPKVGKSLDEIFEARAKRAPRLPSESKEAYSKRLAKMKTDLGGPAKVSVKDVAPGKQAGPGGKPASAAAARAARLKEAVAAGGAAGTAAQIVQEIIARATTPEAASSRPPPVSRGPGAQPGSGARASSETTRNTPPQTVGSVSTGSQTRSPGASPGRRATRSGTRVAPSSSASSPVGILARLGIPTSLPGLIQEAEKQFLARLINPPARAPAPIVFPPIPQPVPQPAPLTGFGPGGVGSARCECKPKRRAAKRKPRTVCYTGRFSETATGTLKYDKRRRTTCQPSRKKPASQRAQ